MMSRTRFVICCGNGNATLLLALLPLDPRPLCHSQRRCAHDWISQEVLLWNGGSPHRETQAGWLGALTPPTTMTIAVISDTQRYTKLWLAFGPRSPPSSRCRPGP